MVIPVHEMHMENLNFAGNKSRYDTFQLVNNKGADQTACLCLCCSQTPKDRFSGIWAHILQRTLHECSFIIEFIK